MKTFGLRDHGRPGLRRLSKTLIGLLCALAMLLGGMLATGTAQAEETAAASGDVTLDWNWDGHTPEEVRDLSSKGISTATGTRQGDAWIPTVNDANRRMLAIERGTLNNSMRDFIGWNTKQDGTGDWYDYMVCSNEDACNDSNFMLLSAPQTSDGNVLYPTGGKLYAQWEESWNVPEGEGIFPVERLKDIKAIDGLDFKVYGWDGRGRANVIAKACTLPSSLNRLPAAGIESCLTNPQTGDEWKISLGVLHIDGSATLHIADSIKRNPQVGEFFKAAFDDPTIKYIQLTDETSDTTSRLGAIELRTDPVADSQLNVPNSPRIRFPSYMGAVGDLQVGGTFDPKAGIILYDAQGKPMDLNSVTIKTTGEVNTKKIGAYPVGYTVTDAQGYSTYSVRVVEVTTHQPTLDELTDALKNNDLIPEDQVTYGDPVTVNLDKYVGHTVDIYSIVQYQFDGKTETQVHASTIVVKENGSDISYGSEFGDGIQRFVIVSWNEPTKIQEWDSVKVIAKDEDLNKPVFEGADDITIDVGASFDPRAGVTAKDDVDGDVTANIRYPQAPDTSKPGLHELFYDVTDRAGNHQQWSRVVVVAPSGSQVDQQLTEDNKDAQLEPIDDAQIRAGEDTVLQVSNEFHVGETVAAYAYPARSSTMSLTKARAAAPVPSDARIPLTQNTQVSDQHTIRVPIPSSVSAGEYRIAVIGATVLKWNDLTILPAATQQTLVNKITVTGQQSLTVGDATRLTAKVEPDKATDKTVSWSSSNEQVATVDKNTGKVSAKAEGKATITATANDGSNVSGELTVTVTAKNPSKVDKTDLDKTVKDIENAGLKQSDYTADSWEAFQDALAKAKAVLKDANATQEQVNTALKALTDAKDGLKKPTPSQPSQPSTPSTPSTPSQPSAPEVSSKPNKLEYRIGEQFDATGMVVKYQGHVLGPDQYTVTLDTSKPGKVKALIALDSDPTKAISFEVTVVVSDTVVHRLYNRWSGEHFYTADEVEYRALVKAKWTDEGTAFTMADYGTPVYRLYLPGGKHLFTTSAKERDALKAGKWRDEGVAFHVRDDGTAKTEVYRLYNPWTGDHLLTTSANERGVLALNKWHVEGTAFQAK